MDFNNEFRKLVSSPSSKKSADITNAIGNIANRASTNSVRTLLTVVILIYFGSKIYYSALDKYSIRTSKQEMADFVMTAVLTLVLYYMGGWTGGHLNWLFVLGAALGAQIPLLVNLELAGFVKYVLATAVVGVLMIMIVVNAMSSGQDILYYILQVAIILLVLFGLILTMKESRVHRADLAGKDAQTIAESETGFVVFAGQYISNNKAIVLWLLALLFTQQSDSEIINRFLSLIQGIIIGGFASLASYEGIDYLLSKSQQEACSDWEDCDQRQFIIKDYLYKDMVSAVNRMKWVVGISVLVMILVIVLFYVQLN